MRVQPGGGVFDHVYVVAVVDGVGGVLDESEWVRRQVQVRVPYGGSVEHVDVVDGYVVDGVVDSEWVPHQVQVRVSPDNVDVDVVDIVYVFDDF